MEREHHRYTMGRRLSGAAVTAVYLVAFIGALMLVIIVTFNASLRSTSHSSHIDTPTYRGPDRRRPFAGDLPPKAYDGPERRRKQSPKPRLAETAVSRFWGRLS